MCFLCDKTCVFAKKRSDLVDKSTPSISRISSPKTGHHFCGHLELFCYMKNHKKWTKLTIFSYFVMTNFSNMSMPNLPLKILTSSKNHINFRQTFNKKIQKKHVFRCFFRSSKPIKSCSFLVKTDWPGWILKGKSRQNHDIFWDPTLLQFSRKYDQIESL